MTRTARVHRLRRGPSYEVSSEWKTKVEQALEDKGMNRSDLASAIGVTRTAITDLLGDSTSSTLVRRVEEALWPHHGPMSDASKRVALPALGAGVGAMDFVRGSAPVSRSNAKKVIKLIAFEPVEDPSDPGDPEARDRRRTMEMSLAIADHQFAAVDTASAIAHFLNAWRRADEHELKELMRLVAVISDEHKDDAFQR